VAGRDITLRLRSGVRRTVSAKIERKAFKVIFPVRAPKIPCSVKKFPVLSFREFGWKLLNRLAIWASKSGEHARFVQIPC
jgi:hypothetical protein